MNRAYRISLNVALAFVSLALFSSRAEAACPVDMKILVIASGSEADFPAITSTLDRLGTPYTVFSPSQSLTAGLLANPNPCHGFYQGVILANGGYIYTLNGAANLATYEATFGIRQLNWYTYPTPDFGLSFPSYEIDTTPPQLPISADFTTDAQSVFPHVNTINPLGISFAYTYLAQPLLDGSTTPLLTFTDSLGSVYALAVVRSFPDGRQYLTLTFDSNANLLHSLVLSPDLINWVTKGLFLGERHAYMSAQVDDLFIDDADWQPATPCSTPSDHPSLPRFRMDGVDFQGAVTWQQGTRTLPTTSGFTLNFAFNGQGTTSYSNDTLTPAAIMNQGQFLWINHTYDHENLDSATYALARDEVTRNNQIAVNPLGLTNYSVLNLVTPDVSGLSNAAAMQAFYDAGVRYVVSDTSRPGGDNPTFNTGIPSMLQPLILEIPRHPTNLFFNVSTPDAWVAEYNCIYQTSLTYEQILDRESDTLFSYLLKGDIDPLMFHQSNVVGLLQDLLDNTFTKYNNVSMLPILSPTMDRIGQLMKDRAQYNSAGVTASIIPGPGGSITITAQGAATIPVTGLNTPGAESYGGQFISHIHLTAGQSVTYPIP